MDIIIPISIGFMIGIIIFFAAFRLLRNNNKAASMTLISTGIAFLISIIIGGWLGMGLGVVSSGMLLATLLLQALSSFFNWRKKSE